VVLEVLIGIGGISSIRLLSQFLAPHSGVLASLAFLLGGVGIAIWMIGQLLSIPLLIHHGYRPLRAMEHSRKLVQANRLKVMALLGLLLGINLLGLMAASLGLLLSLPFSALLLMASCRTQTAVAKGVATKHFADVKAGELSGVAPHSEQEIPPKRPARVGTDPNSDNAQ
jgi:hypothetical protein